jgi:hypothetical protein
MLDAFQQLLPQLRPVPMDVADWRPPRTLRFVAFLFILAGVLGVTEMFVQLYVFNSLDVDLFAILALLMGRGLLRWQEGWRKCAVFFTWMFLVVAGLMLVVSIVNILFGDKWGMETRVGSWRGPAWFAPFVGGTIGGVAYWVRSVLQRPDIVWHFMHRQLALRLGKIRPGSWNPLRWRFSLGSMFLATIVVAFILARLTADDVLYDTHHSINTSSSGGVTHGVEYGVRISRFGVEPDELLYVVLSTGKHWSGPVQVAPLRERAWLSSPSTGEIISLPSDCQLYELIDGEIRSREERVTKAELNDFIATQPAEWSLDALVKHAEQMRTRGTQSGPP